MLGVGEIDVVASVIVVVVSVIVVVVTVIVAVGCSITEGDIDSVLSWFPLVSSDTNGDYQRLK